MERCSASFRTPYTALMTGDSAVTLPKSKLNTPRPMTSRPNDRNAASMSMTASFSEPEAEASSIAREMLSAEERATRPNMRVIAPSQAWWKAGTMACNSLKRRRE